MHRIAVCTLVLALLAPSVAEAQRRNTNTCCRGNRFSFSPYAGMYQDAYDFQADGSDQGWLLGFKAGYRASTRLTLNLDLGYAHANDVATRGPLGAGPIFDNQWVLLTGGGEFTLVPGTTSIGVGAEAGVAWRRTEAKDDGGPGDDTGWATLDVLVPAVVLRHQFTQRTGLFVSLRDYIFDVLEGPAEHSPAFIMGLSLR